MAVGRISGPLLKANLLRDGVNLAFETDLLFLDVVNGRIGIKTASPTHDLTVNGTIRTTTLEVTGTAEISDFSITGNTISNTQGTINLSPIGANPVIYQGKIVTGDLQLSTNVIETTGTNTDLNITTTGTGQVNVDADMLVNGNLHATGNITADGNIQIGDSNTDNISFVAEIKSNIIPDATNTYDLGSDPATPTGKEWRKAYIRDVISNSVVVNSVTVDGIDLALPQGNIIYVATTGSDTLNAGEHEHDPFLTVKKALSVATAGDTVYIFPGTYQEIFPMTVPAGVTVKGSGIRAVKIVPTAGTNNKDAFLLNGESTIEDLTIADYFFDAVNNTGYAFKFATGLTVTSRSPYIRNITVITKGSVTNAGDPYGFDSNDAGKGAYIDGSVANVSSKEASMLFHSATFITPNQETIVATNGVRIEWLNSFTYFADKGVYAYSSSAGFANQGKTRLRIDNRTGTFAVGNTLTYYDTDGTTVLASGTIASIDGNYISLTGRQLGFETVTDRSGKTIYPQGNAKISTTQFKFSPSSLYLDGDGDFLSIPSQPDFEYGTPGRQPKTIILNGDTAFTPIQSKIGGGSIYFDGTSDYISTPVSSDFAFGTGDFTFEFWTYRIGTGIIQTLIDIRPASGTPYMQLSLGTTNPIRFQVNGATVITGPTLAGNTWTHIAVVRSSGTTRLYVNGVQSGANYADTNNYANCGVTLGSASGNVANYNGYIDEVRISNNARYTGTFTPSTTAFTHDSNSLLLIHGDNDITDDGGFSGNFTIEFWMYPSVAAQTKILYDQRPAEGAYPTIYLQGGVVKYYTAGADRIVGPSPLSANTWHHIAVSRNYGQTRLFVNGVQVGSTYADNTTYLQSSVRIGASYAGAFFNGYIDEVRVSKGIARYISNFTPATSPFTSDLETVLLLHFTGPNNSTIILDDGVTNQDLRTSAGGTATLINFADYSDFGAEIRSIGSANIYGNYGTYGDGQGVVAYLISQNYAYVGSGKKSTNDPNDRIAANEVIEINGAKIYYTSVDNEGNFSVGDYFYVNQKTGDIVFNGVTTNITSASGVTFTDGVNTTTITATNIDTGNIRISGNTVESLTGNLNITSANGTINLQNNTFVTGSLDVSGDVTIGGNIQIGDQSTDSINFVAGINSDLIPATNNTYDLGTSSLRWKNVYLNRAEIDGVIIDNNTIQTSGNDNLTIDANGTGKVVVPSSDVEITQDLTVTNNLTVTTGTTNLKDTVIVGTLTQTGNTTQTGDYGLTGNLNVTGDITSSGYLQLPQIKIENNVVSTTATNTDLNLVANGTGSVITEGIKFEDNNIQSVGTNANINLVPQSTGSVVINSNRSLKIPVGTTAERPATPANGMIRYNTDLSRYEGYNATYNQWLTLSGVQDVDGNTYIKAESSVGANDNVLYFYANGTLVSTIDSTKLFAEKIQTTNLDLTSNTISSISTNTDINLTTAGTGGVRIGNLRFANNTITNTVSGSVTEFLQSSTGYVKVAGTNGVVIPFGNNTDRPSNAVTGMMRYNTELQIVEIYNGVLWGSIAGASAGISAPQAEEISIGYVLTLG